MCFLGHLIQERLYRKMIFLYYITLHLLCDMLLKPRPTSQTQPLYPVENGFVELRNAQTDWVCPTSEVA